ncbi:sulfite exporter TauE/SafE family protein [Serinibacter arcticus]|uniref:Probable membrane transporter protein n=1 Tax=Serinibacter arcticus TaxID=1655435 RepID=A0A2U1ZZX3_9MICO|nr:sulfite exporter TauE/SafE family protein [Serinibacter arcticus]
MLGWLVLGVSALVVGIAKTSIGGVAALPVAGFATFLPAKESTAAVLLLLIVGDVIAVRLYRRGADWAMLRRLLPAVLPGIVLGALLINVVDDRTMTLVIAGCILAALSVQLWLRLRPAAALPNPGHPHLAATIGAGTAAGFTTMVANAAGPVMAVYLLAARVDKLRFVGTNAWFFLLVNVSKVPFSAGLGLFPPATLQLTLVLVPVVLVGAWIGRRVLRAVDQRLFELLTVTAALVAAAALLTRAALTG